MPDDLLKSCTISHFQQQCLSSPFQEHYSLQKVFTNLLHFPNYHRNRASFQMFISHLDVFCEPGYLYSYSSSLTSLSFSRFTRLLRGLNKIFIWRLYPKSGTSNTLDRTGAGVNCFGFLFPYLVVLHPHTFKMYW